MVRCLALVDGNRTDSRELSVNKSVLREFKGKRFHFTAP
jgi:hypothetical protein